MAKKDVEGVCAILASSFSPFNICEYHKSTQHKPTPMFSQKLKFTFSVTNQVHISCLTVIYYKKYHPIHLPKATMTCRVCVQQWLYIRPDIMGSVAFLSMFNAKITVNVSNKKPEHTQLKNIQIIITNGAFELRVSYIL